LNQRYKTNSQGIYIYILYNIYTYIYFECLWGGGKKKDGQFYCQVATDSDYNECLVAKTFKYVVIISEDDLNDPMQKAFFNRFEKQWISYDMAFSSDIAERASVFRQYLCKYFGINSNELKDLFCGFNQDTIPSAISYLYASKIINNANVDINTELLKLFFPLLYFFKVMDLNKNKRLQNEEICFPTFVKNIAMFFSLLGKVETQNDAKSQRNALILVLTNGLERTIFQQRYDECKNVDSYLKVSEFKKEVDDFFQSKNRQMLMLQYQHKNADLTQYFHIKSILENAYCNNDCHSK
ncbi:hypothetical protein RFI_36611, partial [Reticulomyxa filosa]